MKPEETKRNTRRELVIPRWSVPLVWGGIILILQVLLPWVVSRLGTRFGWSPNGPAWWNSIGLIVVLIGIGFYVWCLVFHFRTYRASVRIGFSPPSLVAAGPYRISRNPMYISGLFAWLGWVIFYGSPSVFAALLLLFAVFAFRVIPQEERQLESLFGEDYLTYKHTVRRWIGRF